MKYFKITFILFVAILICSFISVEAYNSVTGIVGVEVPAFKGTYKMKDSNGNIVYKTKTENFSSQFYENVGTVKLTPSGGYSKIKVKILKSTNVDSGWYTLNTSEQKEFDSNNVILTGNYTVQLQQPSYTLYKVSHSGTWLY